MRLRLSNPALIPELVEFLRSRADVIAEEVSDDEVEVSLLGSYNSSVLTRTCARRGGGRAHILYGAPARPRAVRQLRAAWSSSPDVAVRPSHSRPWPSGCGL